jgi:hypothetical protein
MDDLRDENLDEIGNADALLDDSIFEEVELDVLDDDEIKSLTTDDDDDEEDEDEEEEILDELDALAAEEDEEGFDLYEDDED